MPETSGCAPFRLTRASGRKGNSWKTHTDGTNLQSEPTRRPPPACRFHHFWADLVRFNRLVLRGFMSYDELDLDLSEIEMAAIVGGLGAGKPSPLTAITWCLWGKDNRGGEPLINDEYDTCAVRVEFAARGENWGVGRTEHRSGRNSTLMLARQDESPEYVNGRSQTEHKIAETQAK